jgi:hypothetical protein
MRLDTKTDWPIDRRKQRDFDVELQSDQVERVWRLPEPSDSKI